MLYLRKCSTFISIKKELDIKNMLKFIIFLGL